MKNESDKVNKGSDSFRVPEASTKSSHKTVKDSNSRIAPKPLKPSPLKPSREFLQNAAPPQEAISIVSPVRIVSSPGVMVKQNVAKNHNPNDNHNASSSKSQTVKSVSVQAGIVKTVTAAVKPKTEFSIGNQPSVEKPKNDGGNTEHDLPQKTQHPGSGAKSGKAESDKFETGPEKPSNSNHEESDNQTVDSSTSAGSSGIFKLTERDWTERTRTPRGTSHNPFNRFLGESEDEEEGVGEEEESKPQETEQEEEGEEEGRIENEEASDGVKIAVTDEPDENADVQSAEVLAGHDDIDNTERGCGWGDLGNIVIQMGATGRITGAQVLADPEEREEAIRQSRSSPSDRRQPTNGADVDDGLAIGHSERVQADEVTVEGREEFSPVSDSSESGPRINFANAISSTADLDAVSSIAETEPECLASPVESPFSFARRASPRRSLETSPDQNNDSVNHHYGGLTNTSSSRNIDAAAFNLSQDPFLNQDPFRAGDSRPVDDSRPPDDSPSSPVRVQIPIMYNEDSDSNSNSFDGLGSYNSSIDDQDYFHGDSEDAAVGATLEPVGHSWSFGAGSAANGNHNQNVNPNANVNTANGTVTSSLQPQPVQQGPGEQLQSVNGTGNLHSSNNLPPVSIPSSVGDGAEPETEPC
jgi:hypothetical protein